MTLREFSETEGQRRSPTSHLHIDSYNLFDMWNSPKVGILGGGQLGRMLVESANRLNIQANVLDAENAPAKQISFHDGHVTGSFKEREAVRKLAESCDVIT